MACVQFVFAQVGMLCGSKMCVVFYEIYESYILQLLSGINSLSWIERQSVPNKVT